MRSVTIGLFGIGGLFLLMILRTPVAFALGQRRSGDGKLFRRRFLFADRRADVRTS
ncbi:MULTISPECIES: hypothetical protein [Rhizobium/Agrobacterium group]|uniref:hypothetical protein n=1 Tax=Rhizobium/Agrobacterium group TaxID=227290 RepID=UPI001F208DBA|nr:MULTISPECIES: hypothetical protein [Rhizobium/Agrobacterium group]